MGDVEVWVDRGGDTRRAIGQRNQFEIIASVSRTKKSNADAQVSHLSRRRNRTLYGRFYVVRNSLSNFGNTIQVRPIYALDIN